MQLNRVPSQLAVATSTLFALASHGACTFDGSTRQPANQSVDAGTLDLEADAAAGGAGDGCPFASPALCTEQEEEAAGPAWNITANTEFDTDADPLCRTLAQQGGPDACLVLVESFSLAPNALLRLSGSRPFYLATTASIVIDGSFDASSGRGQATGPGANHSACAATTAPEDDIGGAGGGAGGSFAGRGGDGGDGDSDSSLGFNGTGSAGSAGTPVSVPLLLRGGCAGGVGGDESDLLGAGDGGVAGNAGGAVALVAGGNITLTSEASVRATGAGGAGGGVQAGGGGGGSGGLVRIEATQIFLYGNVSASGGGGGEGGTRLISGPALGNSGADGSLSGTPARGGSGAAANAGNGGLGSAMNNSNATTGAEARGGGGGGGGGAGFILVRGELVAGGIVSPAITILE